MFFWRYYDDNKKNISGEEWWIDDARHRLDGPAIIEYFMDGSIKKSKQYWYIEGRLLTEKQFNRHPLVQEYRLNNLINQELI